MAQATIWNPNTAEKKVINVGDSMPSGFSLWTGGNATGEEAKQAIIKKADTSNQSAPPAQIPTPKPVTTLDSSTIASGMSSPYVGSLPDNTASDKAFQTYTSKALTSAKTTSDTLQGNINDIRAAQLKDAQQRQTEANNKMSDYNATEQPLIDQYKQDLSNKTSAYGSVYTQDYYTEQLNERKKLSDEIVGYAELANGQADNASGGATLASVATGRRDAFKADIQAKIDFNQVAIAAIDSNTSLASTTLENGIAKLDTYYTNQINFQKTLNDVFQTSDVKTLTEQAVTDLQTKQKSLDATKTAIQNLMSDPTSAMAANKAGVLLTDTIDEVTQKMNDFYAKNPGYSPDNIANNKALAAKYGDAGINPTDTPEVAAAKVKKSSIYQLSLPQTIDTSDKYGNPVKKTVVYDPETGTYKEINAGTTAASGNASFTDGAGNTWNISGWAANDATKSASMQTIAIQIGQVTDQNLAQKASQFTPRLTPDMIKQASAATGMSWEAIMTMAAQESNGGTSNVAQNNNNFGGLSSVDGKTIPDWAKQYGATIGTPRKEGGNYLKFPDKQSGLNAMAALQAQYGKVASQDVPNTSGLDATQQSILNQVPEGMKTTVMGLVNYKIPLPAGTALRTPYWQGVLNYAMQIDPSFDSTQYNTRLSLRKDFTSGASSKNITSLNTAISHLNELSQKADALNNVGIPALNAIKNGIANSMGYKNKTEFDNAANAVESELAAVFKGMGATDQEIKAWRTTLNSSMSPDQLKGSINTAIDLMGGRLQALESKYETGMGKPADFRFLNDNSTKILQNLGVDVSQLDPNAKPTDTKTVKINGQDVPVGSTIENSKGQRGLVNADGSITPQ